MFLFHFFCCDLKKKKDEKPVRKKEAKAGTSTISAAVQSAAEGSECKRAGLLTLHVTIQLSPPHAHLGNGATHGKQRVPMSVKATKTVPRQMLPQAKTAP